MRLIDADALKDNLRFSHGINEELIVHVPLCEVIRNIDNAPTVTFDDIVLERARVLEQLRLERWWDD